MNLPRLTASKALKHLDPKTANRWINASVILIALGIFVIIGIRNRPKAVNVVTPMYAYVISDNDKISMVDLVATPPKLVGAPITGFSGAKNIAATTRNGKNYLYVTNFNTGTVSQVDLSVIPPKISATISGFRNPAGIAVSGNYGYVTEKATSAESSGLAGNLVRFNLNTNLIETSSRIAISADPFGIAISGNYAYIANQPDGTSVTTGNKPGITKYDIGNNPPTPVYSGDSAVPGTAGIGYWNIAINDGIAYAPSTGGIIFRFNVATDTMLDSLDNLIHVGGMSAYDFKGLAFYNGMAYLDTYHFGSLFVPAVIGSRVWSVSNNFTIPNSFGVQGIAIAPPPALPPAPPPVPSVVACVNVAPNKAGAVGIGAITVPTAAAPANSVTYTVTGGTGLMCSQKWYAGITTGYPDTTVYPGAIVPVKTTLSIVKKNGQTVAPTSSANGVIAVSLSAGDVATVVQTLSGTVVGGSYNVRAYVSNAPLSNASGASTAFYRLSVSWIDRAGSANTACKTPTIVYGTGVPFSQLSKDVKSGGMFNIPIIITNNNDANSPCSTKWAVSAAASGWTVSKYSNGFAVPYTGATYRVIPLQPKEAKLTSVTMQVPTFTTTTNSQFKLKLDDYPYAVTAAVYTTPTFSVAGSTGGTVATTCQAPTIDYGGTAALQESANVGDIIKIPLKVFNGNASQSGCLQDYKLQVNLPVGNTWMITTWSPEFPTPPSGSTFNINIPYRALLYPSVSFKILSLPANGAQSAQASFDLYSGTGQSGHTPFSANPVRIPADDPILGSDPDPGYVPYTGPMPNPGNGGTGAEGTVTGFCAIPDDVQVSANTVPTITTSNNVKTYAYNVKVSAQDLCNYNFNLKLRYKNTGQLPSGWSASVSPNAFFNPSTLSAGNAVANYTISVTPPTGTVPTASDFSLMVLP